MPETPQLPSWLTTAVAIVVLACVGALVVAVTIRAVDWLVPT